MAKRILVLLTWKLDSGNNNCLMVESPIRVVFLKRKNHLSLSDADFEVEIFAFSFSTAMRFQSMFT